MNKNERKEMLYEALLGVKSEYLAEAERHEFTKRRALLPRILGFAAAACLVFALAATVLIPKRERDHWAASPTNAPSITAAPEPANAVPTNEPMSTGAPMTTGAPMVTDAPGPGTTERELLQFGGVEGLSAFLGMVNADDENFAKILYQNRIEWGCIKTREDAVNAAAALDTIPFPILDGYELIEMIFDPATGEYRMQFDLKDRGYTEEIKTISFIGAGDGESLITLDELMEMIQKYSVNDVGFESVDTGDSEHIKRLYLSNEFDYTNYIFRFIADINGGAAGIITQAFALSEAKAAILSLDFGVISEIIVPGDRYPNDELIFNDMEALRRFIGSTELGDAEFAEFIKENRYDESFIESKDDVLAVLSRFDDKCLAMLENRSFEFLTLSLSRGDSYINYRFAGGSSISLQTYSEAADHWEQESFSFTIETDPSFPIQNLCGYKLFFSGISSETYVLRGEFNGGYILIITRDMPLEFAVEKIRSLTFGTLREFADPNRPLVIDPYSRPWTINLEFSGKDELLGFVRAAAQGEDGFNAYLSANGDRFSSIRGIKDVRDLLEPIKIMPLPNEKTGDFDRLFVFGYLTDERDVDYTGALSYEFGGKTLTFQRLDRDENNDGAPYTMDDFMAERQDERFYPIDIGAHAHISRLYYENGPTPDGGVDVFHVFHAEIDGLHFIIDGENISGEEALKMILELDYAAIADIAER